MKNWKDYIYISNTEDSDKKEAGIFLDKFFESKDGKDFLARLEFTNNYFQSKGYNYKIEFTTSLEGSSVKTKVDGKNLTQKLNLEQFYSHNFFNKKGKIVDQQTFSEDVFMHELQHATDIPLIENEIEIQKLNTRYTEIISEIIKTKGTKEYKELNNKKVTLSKQISDWELEAVILPDSEFVQTTLKELHNELKITNEQLNKTGVPKLNIELERTNEKIREKNLDSQELTYQSEEKSMKDQSRKKSFFEKRDTYFATFSSENIEKIDKNKNGWVDENEIEDLIKHSAKYNPSQTYKYYRYYDDYDKTIEDLKENAKIRAEGKMLHISEPKTNEKDFYTEFQTLVEKLQKGLSQNINSSDTHNNTDPEKPKGRQH